MKAISYVAWFLMFCVWAAVTYMILTDRPNLFGILFILVIGWTLLPIKQPCDYRSYSEWWADRKNWRSGYRQW